jgi:hypothetical protein
VRPGWDSATASWPHGVTLLVDDQLLSFLPRCEPLPRERPTPRALRDRGGRTRPSP